MLGRVLLAGLVASATLAACGGDDPPPADRPESSETATIDVGRASGKRALATATGSVDDPIEVRLRVSAAPKQRVSVVWGLACARDDDLSQRPAASGDYVTVPPDIRTLKLPTRDVALCAASARARLARTGRVKVTLLATARRR